MSDRQFLALILAAGHGKRFKSSLPKVLHKVASRPLVAHVAHCAVAAGADRVAVVVGPDDRGATLAAAHRVAPMAEAFTQTERLGTAHATLAARSAIEASSDDVIVLLGDAPLVRPETLLRVRAALADGAAVAVLGFRTAAPAGYGRLVMEGSDLIAIREAKDATPAELAINFCNSGIIGMSGALLPGLLDAIGNDNAQQEYYLTDIIEVARTAGHKVVAIEGPEDDVHGINDRTQLARCEALFQARRRSEMMVNGVTLIDPESVVFAADTEIAPDVEIEPNVFFGPSVTVASGAHIKAFSHLEGTTIASGASVGPFARLRPGTRLGEQTKIGNFVETKNADIGAGAKVSHLSYIGDAGIGVEANIGAGTITCNYDGYFKYRTEIGARAFIGSNSALVAPVQIGDGAMVGSGSVITADVEADALALGRGRQVSKSGHAAAFRRKSEAARSAK